MSGYVERKGGGSVVAVERRCSERRWKKGKWGISHGTLSRRVYQVCIGALNV